jgi:hypothetical protein
MSVERAAFIEMALLRKWTSCQMSIMARQKDADVRHPPILIVQLVVHRHCQLALIIEDVLTGSSTEIYRRDANSPNRKRAVGSLDRSHYLGSPYHSHYRG